MNDNDPPASLPQSAHSVEEGVPVWEILTILHGGREAIILHNGERYRIRITASEKLILTK